MRRFTFFLIVLLLLFNNIVQSKKYLVEVEDENGGSNQENPASVEKVNGEGDEDFNEENATIESEGKILYRSLFPFLLSVKIFLDGEDYQFLTTCMKCHERKQAAKQLACHRRCCNACKTKRKTLPSVWKCMSQRKCRNYLSYWW